MNKTTRATELLAGGLHDFSRYEKREPAKVYGDTLVRDWERELRPLPLVVPAHTAERAAFAKFDTDMRWADQARGRGDAFRANLATERAWVELAAALGVKWAGGAA